MKKPMFFIIGLVVLFFMSWGCNKHKSPAAVELTPTDPIVDCTPINFPDSNLEAKIREKTGKSIGDICQSDCESMTKLTANGAGITDLTGLEYCVNLTTLYLYSNSISDISELSGLTNLTYLDLSYNSINDISELSGLTNLTRLYLRDNSISDISPISGLTNLTDLSLSYNNISNISELSGLTNLTSLSLYNNSISNISALSGLMNLTYLYLWDNSISDISALVDNCDAGGLGSGDDVYLQTNPLSTQATDVDIPYLESNGVAVYQ